ncbi:hypothetical protein Sta7437_4454 [Stanieria cyanosphaera PCC 7437]|uniref:Uncharacterized protein n=1 Tax=Stanieria cyanosphaera (strain ATCC 29371 / PCC 7437) TaxID=111780 RepID=K9Y0T2_STAC7|nr:hypothetical protein [Stanieria cyanosphaera]AFZ37919.1 hypothetical protein Sta7437_4454 [Stanieria cyanosphaera PCC 7437]
MTILYEDRQIICDEEAITIKDYYAPLGGDKVILYSQINSISEQKLTIWSGLSQIWGSLTNVNERNNAPKVYWSSFDPKRLFKNKALVIDDGELVKSVITPDNQAKVFQILQAKAVALSPATIEPPSKI